MRSTPMLWEGKVLCVIALINIYSMPTFRCLAAPMLNAVSQFLIPKVVTQP
jgi:hypothetical protein